MFCLRPWKVFPKPLGAFRQPPPSRPNGKQGKIRGLPLAARCLKQAPESTIHYFASKYFVNIAIWGRSFV